MQLGSKKPLFGCQHDSGCLVQQVESDLWLADAHVSGGEVDKMQRPQKDGIEFLGGVHRIAHYLDRVFRIIASRERDALTKAGPVLVSCDTMLDTIGNGIVGRSSDTLPLRPKGGPEERLNEEDIGGQWNVTGAAGATNRFPRCGESLFGVSERPQGPGEIG